MQPYRYSPLPISDYTITTLPDCETRAVSRLPSPDREAVWNLFWLCMPSVDGLPIYGKRADWFKHYKVLTGAAAAITSDAMSDEHLSRTLLLHPSRFVRAFEIDNHEQYECYEVFGERKWVDCVMERAALAARRMADEVPELHRGNVYSIRGGAAA